MKEMNPIKILLVPITLLLFLVACTDDDKVETPKTEVERIAAELEKMPGYSGFTQMLKDSGMGDEPITVFALSDELLANAGNTRTISDILGRHVVKGKLNTEELAAKSTVTTIGGTQLYVESGDGAIYLNGVSVSWEVAAGSSSVYKAGDIIPAPTGESFIFELLHCRSDFEDENNIDKSYPVEGIPIEIYNARHVKVTTIVTDSDGRAVLRNRSDNHIFYKAIKDDEDSYTSNITSLTGLGHEIVGVFKSREEVDSYPRWAGDSPRLVGDLMYKDQNGNGVIDDHDRLEMCKIPDGENSIVYVTTINKGPDAIFPDKMNIERMVSEYIPEATKEFREIYTYIDGRYSTLESRMDLNASSGEINYLYRTGYIPVSLINNCVDRIKNDPQLNLHYRKELSMLAGCRADAYFKLSLMFGGLGIRDENNYESIDNITRSSLEEVHAFIANDFESSLTYPTIENLVPMICWELYNKRYNNTIRFANEVLDSDAGNFQANIFKAEACMEIGEMAQATDILNRLNRQLGLAEIPGSTLRDEIFTNIREIHTLNADKGFNYYNTVRWEDNGDWPEKYLLLPIPQQEIDLIPGFPQNPGW